ncbi:carbohydrate ABC transporter permease [uncultured Friedmanniella sp.]|uniref:carbohydrate ABC transporter permease n=1 Tax=uncultured Friedmanniella sp. TaxID=335381 RepID=UPI0035C9990E
MRRREYAVLIAPSVIIMFGFLVVPLYRTIRWSFESVAYGSPGTFIGLANYASALTDSRFGRAVLFTVGLTIVTTVVLLFFGYIIATLMNQIGKFRPIVLGILLISYVLPHVVGAAAFSWLFDSNFGGVVNYALSSLTGQEILWFTDPWPNRVMIAMNVVWSQLPFAMLIILAGLQGVPEEVIEAAQIDGVNTLQKHLNVIIPSIRGVVGFAALISIMDILRIFDNLIPLAPQAVPIGNESIMLYIFNQAFREGNQNLGLGSAVSVLTIVLILIMLSPFIRDVFREAKAK